MEISKQTLESIPLGVQQEILLFLDIRSILKLASSNKSFSKILDLNTWKKLTLRDHKYFLCTEPINGNEIRHPKKMTDIEKIVEDEMEANKEITNPFKEKLTPIQMEILEKSMKKISNWKQSYIDFTLKPKYQGFFVGDYGGHGYEFIRIFHKGYQIYAKKLTGDPNVPAGKLTWKGTLNEEMTDAKGYIHLANTGYKDSWWSSCLINLRDINTAIITWYPCEYAPGYLLAMEFFNVRGGCDMIEDEDEMRKSYLIILDQD